MVAELTAALHWPKAYRIIASRYPPVHLFERLSPDPAVWDALIALEQKVNPRLRDELGEISLVPVAERTHGPGASWVMAAFTHLNPKGSRFSDGTYGVYYAAKSRDTAIRETAHHFARFAADSGDGPRGEDMRVLVASVRGRFVDVDRLPKRDQRAVLSGDDYTASRALARKVRTEAQSEVISGIVYPSVRNPPHRCVAAFRPKAVLRAKEERRLRYHWDGARVSRYFDYTDDRWVPLDEPAPAPPRTRAR